MANLLTSAQEPDPLWDDKGSRRFFGLDTFNPKAEGIDWKYIVRDARSTYSLRLRELLDYSAISSAAEIFEIMKHIREKKEKWLNELIERYDPIVWREGDTGGGSGDGFPLGYMFPPSHGFPLREGWHKNE